MGYNIYSSYPDEFEKIDGGILGGLQFYLTPQLSLSGRYYHGLLSVYENAYGILPTGKIYFGPDPRVPDGPIGTSFIIEVFSFLFIITLSSA
jgi:hypothetical protein